MPFLKKILPASALAFALSAASPAHALRCGAPMKKSAGLAKLAATPPAVKGTLKVLVIRLGFSDAAYKGDSAAIAAADDEIVAFYKAMSRNTFNYSFRILPGVLKTPNARKTYFGQGDQLNDKLIAYVNGKLASLGLKAGVDYDRYVVNHPDVPDLPYEGSSGYPNPDQWIVGTYRAFTAAHELGHGIGLAHASGVEGGKSIVPTHSGELTDSEQVEYGDGFDAMGDGGIQGQFNMAFKEQLGWVAASEILDVSQSGTYRVFSHDKAGNEGRILALRMAASGGKYSYYMDHRSTVTEAGRNAPKGVEIRLWNYMPGFPDWDRTGLLDMSPGSRTTSQDPGDDFIDAALEKGKTYHDAFGAFSVTVAALGTGTAPEDSWVDLSVQWGNAVVIRPLRARDLSLNTLPWGGADRDARGRFLPSAHAAFAPAFVSKPLAEIR
jgi:hypothetical protein